MSEFWDRVEGTGRKGAEDAARVRQSEEEARQRKISAATSLRQAAHLLIGSAREVADLASKKRVLHDFDLRPPGYRFAARQLIGLGSPTPPIPSWSLRDYQPGYTTAREQMETKAVTGLALTETGVLATYSGRLNEKRTATRWLNTPDAIIDMQMQPTQMSIHRDEMLVTWLRNNLLELEGVLINFAAGVSVRR